LASITFWFVYFTLAVIFIMEEYKI